MVYSIQKIRQIAKRSIAIYKQLIETGHINTHLLVLKQGKHSKLLHGPDGERYQNVVHAFLRHYNLPHNALFAERGNDDFAKTQPSLYTPF